MKTTKERLRERLSSLKTSRPSSQHLEPKTIEEAIRTIRRGVNVADVAKILEVSRANIYHHFGVWAIRHAVLPNTKKAK